MGIYNADQSNSMQTIQAQPRQASAVRQSSPLSPLAPVPESSPPDASLTLTDPEDSAKGGEDSIDEPPRKIVKLSLGPVTRKAAATKS
jgi:hypothetical protein